MSEFGEVINDAHKRPVQRITCTTCGAQEDIGAGPPRGRLPPHSLAGKFRKRGWETDGARNHTCPDCRAKKREARKERKAMAEAHTSAAGNAKTEAARLATQACFLEMMDGYDMQAKAYKPGYSDGGIAQKVGLSEPVVARIREDNFGPLPAPKPDPLVQITALVKAAERSADVASKALGTAVTEMLRHAAHIDALKDAVQKASVKP